MAAAVVVGAAASGCGSSSPSGGSTTTGAPATSATNTPTTPPSTTDVTPSSPTSTPTSAPDLAAVVGNGRHYGFASANVPTTQWPTVCDLLPTSSIKALLSLPVAPGAPDQGDAAWNGCSWRVGPANTGFGVGVQMNQIGSGEAAATYQSNLQTDANDHPQSVAGIGAKAFVAQLSSGGLSASLDVLSGPAEFSVTLISYNISNPVSDATLRSDVVALGKAIAPEFAAS